MFQNEAEKEKEKALEEFCLHIEEEVKKCNEECEKLKKAERHINFSKSKAEALRNLEHFEILVESLEMEVHGNTNFQRRICVFGEEIKKLRSEIEQTGQ